MELRLQMPCSGNGDGAVAIASQAMGLNDRCLGSTGEGSGSVVGSEACSAGGRPCAVGIAGTAGTLRRLLNNTAPTHEFEASAAGGQDARGVL